MACQSLFSMKNKENIVNLSSAEFASRAMKVNIINLASNKLLFVVIKLLTIYLSHYVPLKAPFRMVADDILFFFFFFFFFSSRKLGLIVYVTCLLNDLHEVTSIIFKNK